MILITFISFILLVSSMEMLRTRHFAGIWGKMGSVKGWTRNLFLKEKMLLILLDFSIIFLNK